MTLAEQLRRFVPFNEEEARDRDLILTCLEREPDVFTRENALVHMTASCWIVNPTRTRILMAYHNLYQSWAWLGGHADGDENLLRTALREAQEESGVVHVRPVSEEIFSVEALPVFGHWKRGQYVSCHTHLNVTYLLEADDEDELHIKPDENSGVRWFTPEEALRAVSEDWMREHVYQKLNAKLFG